MQDRDCGTACNKAEGGRATGGGLRLSPRGLAPLLRARSAARVRWGAQPMGKSRKSVTGGPMGLPVPLEPSAAPRYRRLVDRAFWSPKGPKAPSPHVS